MIHYYENNLEQWYLSAHIHWCDFRIKTALELRFKTSVTPSCKSWVLDKLIDLPNVLSVYFLKISHKTLDLQLLLPERFAGVNGE